MLTAIIVLLAVIAVIYGTILFSALYKNRHNLNPNSWWKFILIGLITDIGDALGIGNLHQLLLHSNCLSWWTTGSPPVR